MDNWIQTHSGRRVSLTNPDPSSIDIDDISWALSMQCRFNGHTKRFYSVGEHSIHVSQLLVHWHHDPLLSMAGLLHDAAEAYLSDISRPLKPLLTGFRALDDNMSKCILIALCHQLIDVAEDTEYWLVAEPLRYNPTYSKYYTKVKSADDVMLATEARNLIQGSKEGWNLTHPPIDTRMYYAPTTVYKLFKSTYESLLEEV